MTNTSLFRLIPCLGISTLAFVGALCGCGSPGEVDRGAFPGIGFTGYTEEPGRHQGMAGAGSPDAREQGDASGLVGSGGAAATLPSGCAADPIELMRKPYQEGGCQDPAAGGCHGTGPGEEFPDLLSPGVVTRLLGVPARCDDGPADLILIPRGAGDSFFVSKMADSRPICGDDQMPAFPGDPNSPASRAVRDCLSAWAEQLAAGSN